MPVAINNVTYGEAVAAFRRFGFCIVTERGSRRRRGRGSHVNMTNGIVTITLPDWGHTPLKGPTLGSELERAGIDVTAFLWALGRHNRRVTTCPHCATLRGAYIGELEPGIDVTAFLWALPAGTPGAAGLATRYAGSRSRPPPWIRDE